MKKIFVTGLTTLMALGLAGTAMAFHSGGVAECDGCHTMHNSYEGTAMRGYLPQYSAGVYLLQGNTQSEACLNCHEGSAGGYRISTPLASAPSGTAPGQFTPGGDFRWLSKDYSWSPRPGSTETSLGERKGHNIIAPVYNYVADSTQTVAPGGTYPASSLHCSSCHDPHGKYRRNADGSVTSTGLPIVSSGSYSTSADPSTWGSVGVYRILGGAGYQPVSTPGFPFANGAPDAVAPSTYNKIESTTQTKVAYGRGMSEWCANCHGEMLENAYVSGEAAHTHPAGNSAALPATYITNYNGYKKSGDLTGDVASSYLSLTPYEEGTGDYAVLKGLASSANLTYTGPDGGENVSCLSCHRAHATGYDSMMRFGMAIEYITVADATGAAIYPEPGTGYDKVAMGRTAAEQEAALYGRPAASWAPYQRVLCNKCHAKD